MYDDLWAKSEKDGLPGESLELHTQMALSALETLYSRAPDIGKGLEMPRFWHRVALSVLLHDVGKCAGGFQEMLRGGKRFPYRHEVLSVGFLPWVLGEDKEDDLHWIAAGILSHHRDLPVIMNKYPERYQWFDPPLPDSLDKVVADLEEKFFEVAPGFINQRLLPFVGQSPMFLDEVFSVPRNPGRDTFKSNMRMALNAFAELDDKISQQRFNDPKTLSGRFIRGFIIMADHAASAHQHFRTTALLSNQNQITEALEMGDDLEKAYDHQREAANTLGNSLLVAPTGSGKTEASLFWAVKNAAGKNQETPLFYVLPYQASLNAMRHRLGGIFGQGNVCLQHSRALQALYRQLSDMERTSCEAKKMALREISLGKLHASPVRLLTPYQLLKGAFQLKGHEALWTDCHGGKMIFDEIHAYDPKRLGMLLGMLQHLTEDQQVRLLFMSATFPSVQKNLLREKLHCEKTVIASPETYAKFKRHRLHLLDEDLLSQEVEERILRQLEAGMSVLVVATTVSRAQSVYERLINRVNSATKVELLHGKFCPRHRFSKEQELLQLAGGKSDKPRNPFILVATQVVEVSLDIDFDVLFCDPAPLEALLQRFGRINRRRRHGERDVFVMTHIPEKCSVYDTLLVEQALLSISPHDGSMIEEQMVQLMLDDVYAGEIGDWWQDTVLRFMIGFRNNVLESLYPFKSDDGLKDAFSDMFEGQEVLPASLLEDYVHLSETEPLLSPELLVPVTLNQFHMLKRQGCLDKYDDQWVANAPYTDKLGLQLDMVALNEST